MSVARGRVAKDVAPGEPSGVAVQISLYAGVPGSDCIFDHLVDSGVSELIWDPCEVAIEIPGFAHPYRNVVGLDGDFHLELALLWRLCVTNLGGSEVEEVDVLVDEVIELRGRQVNADVDSGPLVSDRVGHDLPDLDVGHRVVAASISTEHPGVHRRVIPKGFDHVTAVGSRIVSGHRSANEIAGGHVLIGKPARQIKVLPCHDKPHLHSMRVCGIQDLVDVGDVAVAQDHFASIGELANLPATIEGVVVGGRSVSQHHGPRAGESSAG